ncbi:ABC transporter ATP-binding protein [Flavimaricola marinus]|uniref:Bicarbonate transport ATP-binding protein CmpD n=1 Tax=Flavimaricola marinus TaxID=1819565 RepID=A0A238LE63_9RHOB|nr:ABC transporter ATP-binding protein [Flavimaricola marinus]SMY07685.1 Bicarbonate transport ATP-binding protein CmpD [Flavimaricola marinus]
MTAQAKIHDLNGASREGASIVTGHTVGMEFPGPVTALHEATFGIKKGEFISLIGPSGCGKSTLLRIVAGLLKPTSGRVNVLGSPMVGPRPEIGMMFQKATLLDWKSVLDNVLLPNTLAGSVTKADRERAVDLLHLVGLRGFEVAFPRQLSGGMQQRVALARLLNSGAELLLLDEPFGALDEFTRERLNLELMRIQSQIGATIMFVTHNIQEAVFLADRVFVMTPRPGRIAAEVEVALPRPRTIEQMKSREFTDTAFNIRDTLGGFI